ncbi:MAG: glycosyltransferase [archaeon]
MVHSEPGRLPRIHLERDTLRKAGHDAYILDPVIEARFSPKLASAALRYSSLMAQEFAQRPDAYHVMNIPDILAIVPVLKKNKFVYDVRSPWAEEIRAFGKSEELAWVAEKLEQYLTRHADVVIAVNRILERRAYDWGAKSVYVLPNYPPQSFAPSLPPDEFRQSRGLTDRKVVLFVGKFSAVECTIDLVKMLNRIVELVPDVMLVMIGDGPQRAEIDTYISSQKLNHHVMITGWIPNTDVPNWISIADVCVLPRREDMPSARFYSPHSVRKVGEYLALGKSIIATPVGEFADTDLPIIVAPLAEFPQAIRQAIDNPPPVAMPRRFTWESTEPVLIKAYDELEHMM